MLFLFLFSIFMLLYMKLLLHMKPQKHSLRTEIDFFEFKLFMLNWVYYRFSVPILKIEWNWIFICWTNHGYTTIPAVAYICVNNAAIEMKSREVKKEEKSQIVNSQSQWCVWHNCRLDSTVFVVADELLHMETVNREFHQCVSAVSSTQWWNDVKIKCIRTIYLMNMYITLE